MTPRPILKHSPPYTHDLIDGFCSPNTLSYNGALPFASSSHIPPLETPHVHFPPTPILTQLGMTHSSQLYDRKPIQVLPNSLALPERGERKVESTSDGTDALNNTSEFCDFGYFHPMRYLASNTMDVDSVPSPSSNSMLFMPEPAVTPAHSAPSRALETMSQNSSFDSKCASNRSSELDMDRYTSLSAAELSASISISIHFSHPVNDDSDTSPSFNLPLKRDLESSHSAHRKKSKRRRETATYSSLKFDPNKVDGYGLGINYLSKQIEGHTDNEIDASGSSSSFCQSSFEDCLSGF